MVTNKEKTARITKIAVFLLIIGLSLCFFAWFFLPKPITPPQRKSFNSRGFVFKTTEMIDLHQSEFKIIFSDIDCENGTVTCKIIADPFLNMSSDYSSAFFLLQIPFEANNVNVQYLAGEPEAFGGNESIRVINNLTYVMFNIPKENKVRYNEKGRSITYSFNIESVFNQLDWYTYEFSITCGGGLNIVSKELVYLKEYDFYYSLLLYGTQRSFLHVERSEEYYYSNTLPNFDQIGVWSNGRSFTSYYWDLKAISPGGRESSIILELKNLETKYKIDLRFSVVWFLSGVGVPLAFSSGVEFYKNKELFKESELKQSLGLWLISGVYISTFMFVIFCNFLL